jgi:hypothetical protein
LGPFGTLQKRGLSDAADTSNRYLFDLEAFESASAAAAAFLDRPREIGQKLRLKLCPAAGDEIPGFETNG